MVRLAIRCQPEQAEAILAELLELVPGGVEESRGDGFVEFAVYGPPGEIPELPDIEAVTGEGLVAVETTEVADDWADRWRDFHRPVVVAGGRLVVRPTWEGRDARTATEIEIEIDPGRAFGTGSHATTRGCLEEMLRLADEGEAGGSAVDWGTGSGVLAIAAARLGWDPVRGVDHEPPSVEIARANAKANDVILQIERLNLREETPPVAGWVFANLTAPLLLDLAGRVKSGSIPAPGHLLLSGVLERESDDVERAFAEAGMACRRRSAEDGWAVLLLDLVDRPTP